MKIGNRTVLETYTFLLAAGETEARLSIDVRGWKLPVLVRFNNTADAQPPAVSIENVSSEAVVSLRNWRNSLGTATTTPLSIARLTSGEPVFLMICHWLIGTMNRLDLQFLLGDAT